MEDPAASIHASCVAIGDGGVLIRGPSGAGKSWLALRLILDPPRALAPAELVADDRVHLAAAEGTLVARPAPRLAGLIEARGLGVRRMAHRPFVAVRWLVDLAAGGTTRMPSAPAGREEMHGIEIKRVSARTADEARVLLATLLATDDYEN